MGTNRKLALLLLIAYSTFAIVVSFHSHQQEKDQWTLHCKLCQASQTQLEHTRIVHCTPDQIAVWFQPESSAFCAAFRLQVRLPGRAPPAA